MERSKLNLDFSEKLTGILIHPDGSHVNLGNLAKREAKMSKWRRCYEDLKRGRHLPATLTFAAFLAYALRNDPMLPFLLGGVTYAGYSYMAADFLASSTNHIQEFKYCDSGIGSDLNTPDMTGLVAPTGLARVVGVQSNPSDNDPLSTYQVDCTITYDADYIIGEWGLFSAPVGGTMWGRLNIFMWDLEEGLITIHSGDSIAFSYALIIGLSGPD